MNRALLSAAICFLRLCAAACADDWPQWLGPQRDSVWRETGIIESIPDTGLPVLWRVPVHGGYAGPAVANGRVFVTDFVANIPAGANDPNARTSAAGRERVLCLSEASGEKLWEVSYECKYDISYPQGPRCTPTVEGTRVYALGAQGRLLCLDVATGQIHWQKDFVKDFAAPVPMWGWSSHPLIHGDNLICIAGGPECLVVAFHKITGEEAWRVLSAKDTGYSPPTLITHNGRQQLLAWDAEKLHSLQPETGKENWSLPIAAQYGMSVATPRLVGDVLFASAIGNVGGAYKLAADGQSATAIWENDPALGVYCALSAPLIEQGTIYAADCRTGGLRAVELATGKRLWETYVPTTGKNRAGHGNAFLVQQGGRCILFSETGDLIMAKLSPEKYEEQGRFHILEPTSEALGRNVVWSHPAYANGCCFARNDKELVKVSLKK